MHWLSRSPSPFILNSQALTHMRKSALNNRYTTPKTGQMVMSTTSRAILVCLCVRHKSLEAFSWLRLLLCFSRVHKVVVSALPYCQVSHGCESQAAHLGSVPRHPLSLHLLQRFPRLSGCSKRVVPPHETVICSKRNSLNRTTLRHLQRSYCSSKNVTCLHHLDTPRRTPNVKGALFPATHGDVELITKRNERDCRIAGRERGCRESALSV